MIDLLTIGYMGGATVFAGLSTYLLTKRNRKDQNVFTIKSDGGVSLGHESGGYQPKKPPLNSKRPRPNTVPPRQRPTAPNRKAPELILDMNGVTGIIIKGSSSLTLSKTSLKISSGSIATVKKHTLWIEHDSSIQLKGAFDGAMLRTETNHIETINFASDLIDRVSVQGSGDLDIDNMKFPNGLSAIVKGSGDINIDNSKISTLSLSIKGSGDIVVGSNVDASHAMAEVNGSGDIIIKSTRVGKVSQKVRGAGDISTPSSKGNSYFSSSQQDGRYFNRNSSTIIKTTSHYTKFGDV